MDVHSLGFRTDLALLQRSGSQVEDRVTHLVVRTPDNPTYYWGNFVLLAAPPASVEQVQHWMRIHRQEFPDAQHVSLGVDRPGVVDDDVAVLRAAGLEVESAVSMTATSVQPTPHPPPRDAEVRTLDGDDDWSRQVDLMVAGEDDRHVTREFAERRVDADRLLVESGTGAWWGAFVDDRLVASLGIFAAGPGLARFQAVKTLEEVRGQGLAGTLVVRASRYAAAELGAERLVMVADPSYSAIRIYRSVGFTEGGTHLEASLVPGSD